MVRNRPPAQSTRLARALRSNATEAERRMWALLRENFPQARFRRQVPIRNFVADFASHRLKLVVEVDGGQHTLAVDARRTAFIEAEGYQVIRFWNHEVLGNADGVALALAEHCTESTPTKPPPSRGRL